MSRPENILIVDDEESLLESLESLLKEEGYNVETADNGEHALEEIENNSYDLIVLDVRLPDFNGIDLLKKVRKMQEEDEESRVIIVTAYASEEAPIKALRLGADDYLMKPFDMDEFLHSVKRNIHIAELEKEREQYIQKLERLKRHYKNLVESLTRVVWTKTQNDELENRIREILEEYEKEMEE